MTKPFFLLRLAIFSFGILFLVSCAPVATTVGTPIPEVEVGVVVVDLLNIREGPGTNYPILGSLAKGEKFYILSEVLNSTNNKWLLISQTTDSFGWVIGDQTYVTFQRETVDLSTFLIWQKNVDTAKSILAALTPTPQ
jgi:uncharacterized protein YgiM (DUF1202 family)